MWKYRENVDLLNGRENYKLYNNLTDIQHHMVLSESTTHNVSHETQAKIWKSWWKEVISVTRAQT